MEMMKKVFDENFLWGAASSAAQIEGAFDADGKGLSIWDIAPAEKIRNGDSCHDGCDHYHHFREDAALMKQMGLKSYRFSVSWPRVMPEEGVINEKGLQFYSDLVDELLSAGIEPMVTLYHWDLPVWADKKGGWLAEAIIPLFQEYVKAVVDKLSDRTAWWMVMNEIHCFVWNGYLNGIHAPFQKNVFNLNRLTRNVLKAQAAGVRTIRMHAVRKPMIGSAVSAGAYIPLSEQAQDIEQAYRESFYSRVGTTSNRWWSDPAVLGKPASIYGLFRSFQKDMADIRCDFDFIGINFYAPWLRKGTAVPEDRRSSLGWAIDGRGLYWVLRFYYQRYHLPLLITENGISLDDRVSEDGSVHDEKRIGYIREYLDGVSRAVQEGIPVLGYQYWSLTDNFEWAEGYAPRFGLIYVDYETKKRIIKDSGYAYADIIRKM